MKLFDICLVDEEKIVVGPVTIFSETAEDAVWEVLKDKELEGITVIVREWASAQSL